MPTIHTFQGEEVILFSPEALSDDGELLLDRSGWDTARAFCVFLPASSGEQDNAHEHDDAAFAMLWHAFVDLVDPEQVEHLILGMWDPLEAHEPEVLYELILPDMPTFTNLSSLFLGDIDADALEMAWIRQADVGPLLSSLPSLRFFGVRGGDGLRLSSCPEHPHLESLVIESTGLSPELIEEIANMQLPALRHLELWLGEIHEEEDALESAPLEGVASISRGLESLALCNTAWSAARRAALHAVLHSARELHVLDLSGGTLDDEEVMALLQAGAFDNLEKLILSRNYIQSTDTIEALSARPIELVSKRQKELDASGERLTDVGS